MILLIRNGDKRKELPPRYRAKCSHNIYRRSCSAEEQHSCREAQERLRLCHVQAKLGRLGFSLQSKALTDHVPFIICYRNRIHFVFEQK